jgi:formylglycine-generating enzyme required for sulfatase activity
VHGGTGPAELLVTLPASGQHLQKDTLVLNAYAARRAEELGVETAHVRQYFEGRKADGTRVVWSTSLTLNFEAAAEGPASPPSAGPKPAAAPPKEKKGDRDSADMLLITSGGFHMGTDGSKGDDGPMHPVQISKRFYIYKTEVTNAQYWKFVDETGHREPPYWEDPRFNRADQPVVGISWDDAAAYAAWAGGRLPTEAEWEYVARGKDLRKYAWGNQEPDATRAIFAAAVPDACGKRTASGVKDMPLDLTGNVAEWCADWFSDAYYLASPVKDPKGPETGTLRVVRGGAWNDAVQDLQTHVRKSAAPDTRAPHIGFRVVIPQ